MSRRVSMRGTRLWQNHFDASFRSKVIGKKWFLSHIAIFDTYWPPEPYLLELYQFWLHLGERSAQKLSIAIFRGILPIIVSEIMSYFRKIGHFIKFDLWWPLVTSVLTWAKKWRILELLQAIECRLPHLSIVLGFRDSDGVEINLPRHGASCQEARHGAG